MLNVKAISILTKMLSDRVTFHKETQTIHMILNPEKNIFGIYSGKNDLTLYDFEGKDYESIIEEAIKKTNEESTGNEESEEYQITLISNVLDLLNNADEKDTAGFTLGSEDSDSKEDNPDYFCIADSYQTQETAKKDPFFAQLMKKANSKYKVHFKTFGTKFKKRETFGAPTINCKVLINTTPSGIKHMTGADIGIQNRIRSGVNFERLMEKSVEIIEKECLEWSTSGKSGTPIIGLFCSAGKHRCRAIAYFLKAYCYPNASITHLIK